MRRLTGDMSAGYAIEDFTKERIGSHRVTLDRLKRDVFRSLLKYGLQNEEELHFFIRVYLNLDIPKRVFCPHHISPFAFIADQFFERHRTVLGFATRAGGKTINTAVLNVVEAVFKPNIEIISAGAIRKQAEKGYEYFSRMLNESPYLGPMVETSLMSKTVLANGSVVSIVTGSYHGMNSPHPNKVRIDEVELMHPKVLQEGLQMSVTSRDGKWRASDCLTSTRKFFSGTMQQLLDEADRRGIVVKPWCIWEVLQPCTRKCRGDPVYGDCPVYSRISKDGSEELLCGGKAHHLSPGGFFSIDDFVDKASKLDIETFRTQWENERPHAGSLVYGRFFKDEPPFILTDAEEQRVLQEAREHKWPRVVGVDFGANFYAGYFVQDPHAQIWYQYGEYWYSSEHDIPLAQHAQNIKQRDPLGWSAATTVFADPSGRQAMRDIEEYGIFATPANNALYEGINHIKLLLTRRPDGLPRLRFFRSCERMRKELGMLYSYRIGKDGQPTKDTILKKNDHAADALRYALFSWETVGTGRYRAKRLRGVY